MLPRDTARWTVAAGLAAAVLAGCSGGSPGPSAASVSPTPSPTVSPTVLPHRGGLVGAIDSARLVSICENVRLAETAVAGGLDAAADQAFTGIARALRQSPSDPALVKLADRWGHLRQREGDRKAVDRMQAFCAREGG